MQALEEDIWTPEERKLYPLLFEEEFSVPFSVRELLREYGLDNRSVNNCIMQQTLQPIIASIGFINKQLGKNPQVYDPILIRHEKYPLTRQMRDVHSFDVGSHLVACHSIAVRGVEGIMEKWGAPKVAEVLNGIWNALPLELPSLAAIYHDFFKCLRPRRPLPAKIGKKHGLTWLLPNGEEITDDLKKAKEAEIAEILLPFFIKDRELCRLVIAVIKFSEGFTRNLYKALDGDKKRAGVYLSSVVSDMKNWPIEKTAGFGLAMIDLLGKGWAIYVLTERKGRSRTLRDAGVLMVTEANRTL